MTLADIEKVSYKELSNAIVDGLYDPLIKAYIDGISFVDYYYKIKSEWKKDFDIDDIEKREKFAPIYSIRRFLDNYRREYFKDLDATTRNWTLHYVKTVIEEGGTAEDLWKKLEGTKGMTKSRAEVIYRTETNRAFNWGMCTRLSHLKCKGYIRCIEDERSCSECIARNGEEGTPDELRNKVPRHPNCFLDRQVKVYTSEGWKAIGDIKIGDYVLTHKGRFKKVYALPRNEGIRNETEVVHLVIKVLNQKGITITSNHPILVIEEGSTSPIWKEAGDIKESDKICLLANTIGQHELISYPIREIIKWKLNKNTKLYNLSVEEDESYIAEGIVVHNCRCQVIPLTSKDEVKDKNPDLEFEEDPLFGEYQSYHDKYLEVARRYLNDHPEVTDQEWKYFIEEECPNISRDLRDWTRSVQYEGGLKLIKTERSFTTSDKFRPPRKDSFGDIIDYNGEITEEYKKEYLKASAYHRAGFERKYKEKKVRLYRGSTTKKDSQYLSAPLESYTTNIEVAKDFAGKEGQIIYRDFDLDDVRFAHPYFGLPYEEEVVISHRGPYDVKIYEGE